MVNMQDNAWIGGWRSAATFTFETVSPHNDKAQSPIYVALRLMSR
jgi:hypothetical protein